MTKKSIGELLFGLRGVTLPEEDKLSGFYKRMLAVAWPAALEGMLVSLMNSFDTMMVGKIGPVAIAAVGLCAQPRMILLLLVQAVCVGTTSVIARRRGEERQDAAVSCLKQSLALVTALGILITVAGYFLADPFLSLAGANEETLPDARIYFRIVAAAFMANCWSLCICAAQRGIGKTRITMWVNMASNLINVFFNYCLIGGHLGFPRMEVQGAALASAIGMGAGFLLALATVVAPGKYKGYLHLSFHDSWRFDKESMRSIVKVGGNAAIEQFGVRFGFFVYARILFSLGTTMYAANQICMQLLSITFTFGDGLGVAATSLVGQNLGRKRADLSMLYGKISQRFAVMISLVLGVLIVSFRYQIAGWFIGENTLNADQVVAYAASTMLVLAAIQPFQTSSVVLSGSLRGAGDNLYVALIATICVSVVRPIMAVIAVYVLHLGLTGTWIFGLSEIALRFAFFYPRFASGKWKDKKV